MPARRTLSVQEAARTLGVSDRRVIQLIDNGTLKATRNFEDHWAITPESVKAHHAKLMTKPSRRARTLSSLAVPPGAASTIEQLLLQQQVQLTAMQASINEILEAVASRR